MSGGEEDGGERVDLFALRRGGCWGGSKIRALEMSGGV